METKLVNIHHKISYDVYIGRGSIWGNPFSHMEGTKAKFKVATREEAVTKYRDWILTQPNLLKKLHTLKGKRLGCFCYPKLCHGNVLIELIEEIEKMVDFAKKLAEKKAANSKKKIYRIKSSEQLFNKWMKLVAQTPTAISAIHLVQNDGEATRDKLNEWVKNTDREIEETEKAFADIIEQLKALKQETIDYIIKTNS